MSDPSSELATPAPSPASECDPPPPWNQSGGATLACGWGGEGSQFGRLQRKPCTLYTLWFDPSPCRYMLTQRKLLLHFHLYSFFSLCWRRASMKNKKILAHPGPASTQTRNMKIIVWYPGPSSASFILYFSHYRFQRPKTKVNAL